MKAVVVAFNQEMALVWALVDQSCAALVTVPLNYCSHIVAGRCAECEQCAASCSGSGHGARLPSVSAISILHHHLLDRCSPFNTSLNISLSILHHDVLVHKMSFILFLNMSKTKNEGHFTIDNLRDFGTRQVSTT